MNNPLSGLASLGSIRRNEAAVAVWPTNPIPTEKT